MSPAAGMVNSIMQLVDRRAARSGSMMAIVGALADPPLAPHCCRLAEADRGGLPIDAHAGRPPRLMRSTQCMASAIGICRASRRTAGIDEKRHRCGSSICTVCTPASRRANELVAQDRCYERVARTPRSVG